MDMATMDFWTPTRRALAVVAEVHDPTLTNNMQIKNARDGAEVVQ